MKKIWWAAIDGISKVTGPLAAAVAIVGVLLLVLFAMLGVEAYVLGDNQWNW